MRSVAALGFGGLFQQSEAQALASDTCVSTDEGDGGPEGAPSRAGARVRGVIRTLLLWAVVGFMWFVAAFGTDNPDHEAYSRAYDYRFQGVSGLFEPGYELVESLGITLALRNFNAFLPFLAAALVVAFLFVTWKVSGRWALLPLVLYSLFPYALDIVQLRYWMAQTVVLIALAVLQSRGKLRIVSFVILCVVAISFHVSSIVFLFFVVALIRTWRYVLTIIGVVGALMWCACLLFSDQIRGVAVSLGIEEAASGSGAAPVTVLLIGAMCVAVFVLVADAVRRMEAAPSGADLGLLRSLAVGAVSSVVFGSFVLVYGDGYRYLRTTITIFFLFVGMVCRNSTSRALRARLVTLAVVIAGLLFTMLESPISHNAELLPKLLSSALNWGG